MSEFMGWGPGGGAKPGEVELTGAARRLAWRQRNMYARITRESKFPLHPPPKGKHYHYAPEFQSQAAAQILACAMPRIESLELWSIGFGIPARILEGWVGKAEILLRKSNEKTV